MPILVIKRLIKPGFERQYEQGLARMVDEAEKMDGYMGANIAKPGNRKEPLYIFSVKFDTQKHLQAYKNSPLRQELLKEWHEQSQKPFDEHTISGLEWWFVLPGIESEVPRYKMVMLSILGAYPVVLILSLIFNGLQDVGITIIKIFLLVLITIFVMNYITMPFLLSLLKNWLQQR